MYLFRLVIQTGVRPSKVLGSSIFNGFKEGVLFAIVADYQVIIIMFKLGLSSQILQNTLRYTGKPIYVTSFSGIRQAVRKKSNIVEFSTRAANHPRGMRVNGNDTCIY